MAQPGTVAAVCAMHRFAGYKACGAFQLYAMRQASNDALLPHHTHHLLPIIAQVSQVPPPNVTVDGLFITDGDGEYTLINATAGQPAVLNANRSACHANPCLYAWCADRIRLAIAQAARHAHAVRWQADGCGLCFVASRLQSLDAPYSLTGLCAVLAVTPYCRRSDEAMVFSPKGSVNPNPTMVPAHTLFRRPLPPPKERGVRERCHLC